MDLTDVHRLYAYDEWANALFLAAAGALTDERFSAPVVSSFPSFRDTLAHIVGAEWIWLRRWLGESPTAPPGGSDPPTLAAVRERLGEVERERRLYLAGLSAADLDRTIAYRRLNGEAFSSRLSDLFVHVVNHSTYHRGQLTTILRQLGEKPPTTDFFRFAGETG